MSQVINLSRLSHKVGRQSGGHLVKFMSCSKQVAQGPVLMIYDYYSLTGQITVVFDNQHDDFFSL